jgi:sugar/nucleoside kinase (ribokinase family)
MLGQVGADSEGAEYMAFLDKMGIDTTTIT